MCPDLCRCVVPPFFGLLLLAHCKRAGNVCVLSWLSIYGARNWGGKLVASSCPFCLLFVKEKKIHRVMSSLSSVNVVVVVVVMMNGVVVVVLMKVALIPLNILMQWR
jgi:hypothetical protein